MMPDGTGKRCGGFTYLAVLILIIIMGIMLGAVGQQWSAYMKREREEELLFRGKQIVDAIARWNRPRPGQHIATPLRDLKDLLKDPRSLATERYLRRMYTDPITGKEWKVVNDPVKGIIGVYSGSDAKPLRRKNFVEMFSIHRDPPDANYVQFMTSMLKSFEGKTKYSEWKFVYGTAPSLTVSGAPETLPTGGQLPRWNPLNRSQQ